MCQDVNVYEQCIAGSRFFDIRLKASTESIRTYHLSAIGGALGQSSVTAGAHHNMDYLKDLLAMGQDKFGKHHLKVSPPRSPTASASCRT